MPRGILALGNTRAPARVLLVRLSHLGDVLHALPVHHALCARFPGARLAWAVQREHAPLLRGLAGLERTIELDRGGGLRAWFAFRRACAEFAPELAVDAQGNIKSGLAMRLSRAPIRLGLARRDWRERLGSLAVNRQAAAAAGPHAIDRARALCTALGWNRDPCFDLSLSEAELAAGRAQLGELRGRADPRAPLAFLALARTGDVRSWPLARWAEAARALERAGARVVAVSGPEEEAEGRALATELAGLANVRHWIGQRGLRELAACFAAAREQGAVLLACDSGPMHLGWIQGLPVVLLAGPQDPARTGPWPVSEDGGGSRHAIVRSLTPPECSPCRAQHCGHRLGPVCMSEIAGARAAAVVLDLARSHAPARTP